MCPRGTEASPRGTQGSLRQLLGLGELTVASSLLPGHISKDFTHHQAEMTSEQVTSRLDGIPCGRCEILSISRSTAEGHTRLNPIVQQPTVCFSLLISAPTRIVQRQTDGTVGRSRELSRQMSAETPGMGCIDISSQSIPPKMHAGLHSRLYCGR